MVASSVVLVVGARLPTSRPRSSFGRSSVVGVPRCGVLPMIMAREGGAGRCWSVDGGLLSSTSSSCCIAARRMRRRRQDRVERGDRLAGKLGDGQLAQQWAHVKANHAFVAGSSGHLHVHYVDVAIHEMVDRGTGAGVALFVDLPINRVRTFLDSASALGPAATVSVR